METDDVHNLASPYVSAGKRLYSIGHRKSRLTTLPPCHPSTLPPFHPATLRERQHSPWVGPHPSFKRVG
jgi:hypothetical protein